MALRRRFKYQWRLFWPLASIVWAIIAVLVVFQYKREVRQNRERIYDELSFITSRVLQAYEDKENLSGFVNFIDFYYDSSQFFPNIRLSVYEESGSRRPYQIGDPIPLDLFSKIESHGGQTEMLDPETGLPTYYKVFRSDDGKVFVSVAMQSSVRLSTTFVQNPLMWILIIALGLAATVVVYIYSHYFARTIVLMRDFANNVASGKPFDADAEFPHDELGDISRHIIELYKEKDAAIARSEREHEIAIHAVTEKARVKHQLTNNINHELKTPVGAIRGYLDTIAQIPDLPPELRDKFLQSARQNVERLVNLLSDVSSMTRLEEGSGSIPLREVDFHDLVYSIDNDLAVTGLAGTMKFTFDIPIDCAVKANANLLNGMVSNLIRNAAQHSQGKNIGLRLVAESGKYYSFSFYDDGVGVGSQHLAHLFDRFYRVDTGRSRKVGGTGLGLSIVKNTVEALGGTITVHNRSTGGLEFVFTLQKWRASDTPTETARETLA